ncbi:MAG: 5-deoxy-glucuronate isomerase [Paracoccaceae bacterium]
MKGLLRKPLRENGKLHDITPKDAGWRYVGFSLYQLEAGDRVHEETGKSEVILVLVEGKAKVSGAGVSFGELGTRMNVFERLPPHCVYIPNASDWSAVATTGCTLAVCAAPGRKGHQARIIGPDGIKAERRGKGANTRFIHNIAMEHRDVADSLLVTEVFTPQGNWSSYPPHRHDEDDFPNVTLLEETYYHRLNPAQGFGFQRVFTEDGEIDETLTVEDGDVVLVPRGHHPCAAPYGYDMYYLNVMAGPKRAWRFLTHPEHEWLVRRDRESHFDPGSVGETGDP